jgi:alkaline phosphatase D
MRFDRRDLMRGGLVLLAGAIAPAPLLAVPRFTRSPFSLGIAAGDPAHDGFVLWTRLLPEPDAPDGGMPALDVPLRWEVAEDPGFRTIARSGPARAVASLAHSVHVEVAGLRPHRPYWYRFLVGGHASPVGTARTAPATDAAPEQIRIASAGCQNYEAGYFTALGHLACERDLDAVFHYGDYIYEMASKRAEGPRLHPAAEAYTLEDYRQRYVLYKSDPDLQAAHAAAAFIMSYDDHEIDDNWAGDFDKDGSPAAAFALRKAAALQAWYEHVPVRRAQRPGPDARMYRRLDYGRLIRMHVLDTRSHRSDQLCEQPGLTPREIHGCTLTDRPGRTMLGTSQEAWLDQGLAGEARWNFLAQQVLMMTYDARKDGDSEPVIGTDNWNGYPLARQRLIDSITRRGLTNVVIGSGDMHQHVVGSLPVRPEEPESPAVASEFLATSVSSNGTGGPFYPGEEGTIGRNANVALLNNQRGYQLYTVTADRWLAEIKGVDQVDRPGGILSTLARFAVAPDRPGPEPA